ncbi:hypothetical protein ERO13_A09G188300v2 [Gossypium hirsutum]|uniref:AB hydrolase-1 domain-containing protein n=3 Tax=Gossypium TaxID=3633 RepID=A0A2P5WVH6_GOSBA|nr:probable lysophospholipase BODYGUARD 3 isoform X1 [Gossypium hirsutum]KAB2067011.1 hypothetical protein ES319_A09G198000v1 [Gossypium barbadense]KAG4184719.1 hypothetical protein ERO13_A09G188300v2 [Gossypium hirsutum]PPR95051.1 hypothetical protein GOBAR_AA25616 [Gossypium barbadense]TYI11585.1 hypothetical protein ES332_A09G217000v1 [Gossypium tomentosum]
MDVKLNTIRLVLVLSLAGEILNNAVSFAVFCVLDFVDFILCFVYKIIDFWIESQWKPCYCSSAKQHIIEGDNILVSEECESKIVCLTSTNLQLEDISDTLYSRPSIVAQLSKFIINDLNKTKKTTVTSTFTIDSTIVEVLRGNVVPRWSDCDCKICNSWTSSSKDTLFVKAEGPKDKAREDVLFIHGFISSSVFWTETLFPNFSTTVKSTYRLLAVDILGFGRSPKPTDSLYTLREHVEMIEKSVLEAYQVKSFHIVAHSLGCILALAIAVKQPGSIKSLTLLAPPYFPVPKGEPATQYIMRRIAPRRVWPVMAFGASVACWYEHISRTICLVVCKNHRLWEFITKCITRNRIRTYLLESFCCHTHNAAWHTLHNIICGTAGKLDSYLDTVCNRLKCEVTIFHGGDDEVIPVECSYNVQRRIPRAQVKVIENKDHISIVVGRQKAFAKELEKIWKRSKCD